MADSLGLLDIWKPKTTSSVSGLADKLTSKNRATEYAFNKSNGTYTPKWNTSSAAGGVGTYAYVPDSNGGWVGMDQAAADTYTSAVNASGGTSNLIDGGAVNDFALGSANAADNFDFLGAAKVGLAGMSLFTDIGNLGVAKDTLKFNKMNANRAYEADKLKYNNGLARTEAVNAVYGSPNVATKLV